MSIQEVIKSLSASEEDDTAFIVAGAINLYSESMRRRVGRILYGPEDVRGLFGILSVLLSTSENAVKNDLAKVTSPARRKPSETETEVILKGLERTLTSKE